MKLLNAGALFAGRFRVERVAGAGGMGVVYRVIDEHIGMPVALKLMSPKRMPNLERFHREAMLLRDLRHPAIVRYVAHGTAQVNRPFLAMEWVEGKTLAETLRAMSLGVSASLRLVLGVARALSVAHHRGVVHRDIKPGNIMLEFGKVDSVKLVDFGIARDPLDPAILTRRGAVVGTPGYLAPEQAHGGGEVDASADVFSLGCVLFECLTGRAAITDRDLSSYEPRLPSSIRTDVPIAVDTLVRRMLSKHPAARPPEGSAVAAQIDAILRAFDSDTAGAAPIVIPPVAAPKELRHVTVVVASGSGDDTVESLVDAGEHFGQSLDRKLALLTLARERIADGTTICTIERIDSGKDQAVRAAQCALILRQHLPDATIAIATGRGVLAGSIPVGDVIDRAVGMLRHSVRSPVRVRYPSRIVMDELTAALLDATFNVRSHEHGFFLVA